MSTFFTVFAGAAIGAFFSSMISRKLRERRQRKIGDYLTSDQAIAKSEAGETEDWPE